MSSTDRTPITYVYPSATFQTPSDAEAWFQSLPPDVKSVFQARAGQVLLTMTPTTRANVARALIQNGFKVPAELGVSGWSGMGSLGDDTGGYGAAAGLVGGLIGAGANILSASMTIRANNSINSSNNAASANIAAIDAGAQVAITKVIADAQVAAATVHAQTTVSTVPTIAKWGAIGAIGAVGLGLGAWLLLRRKK